MKVLSEQVSKASPDQTAKTSSEPASTGEPAWPESDTVLDLLRADARAASTGKRMERAQDWLAMPGSAAGMASRTSAVGADAGGSARDQVELVAIYGVGRALYADIFINGELWRYRQGRRWPQGIDDASGEPRYSLEGIEQPCVRLRWQESKRAACLHSSQGGQHE